MKIRFLLLIPVLALLICGCKKDIDVIGLDLQGDEDLLGAEFIEVPIEAHSMLEDSINTRNLLNNVVGDVIDPVFGRTSAGFCTQFALSGTNMRFGDVDAIDSVVLTLQYSGYFGDTLSPLGFEVYQLAAPLGASAYYSCDDQPEVTGGNLVASTSPVYVKPNVPVHIGSETNTAHLRLRLDNHFGENLMELGDAALSTTSSFQNAFRGLCVRAHRTGAGAGNLSYVSLTSAMTGITIYYHDTASSKKYTFPVSSACMRYNFYTHDYSQGDADFRAQVLDGNQQLGEQKLYVQPTAGVRTRVDLSQLRQLLDGKNVVVNRAELVLTDINADASYFFQPYNLSLQVVNALGGGISYTPDDASYTSTSYFGGIYDKDSKEYRFRITNFVQQILKGTASGNQLNVVISGAGVRGNRLVFRGTDPAFSDHFRLEVYYTEY